MVALLQRPLLRQNPWLPMASPRLWWVAPIFFFFVFFCFVFLPIVLSDVHAPDTKSVFYLFQTLPLATEKLQNGDSANSDGDKEKFLEALRSSIEIFVNRMSSNSARGRPISNDSSVQTLFLSLSQMHPQLLQHIQEQEESRAHYEMLQVRCIECVCVSLCVSLCVC